MSATTAQNNKRIAKNTIALYFRTFITMLVSLYTGRVMLQALGVENYGINAVVGGIVAMSSLLTSTMSQAISRYITYALGKGDKSSLKTLFSTSINAQLLISALAVVVLEVVGIWFLNNEASIPSGRLGAANWVLHCSLLSLIISLVSSPYNALIIAHERMSIYAYFSIVDVTLRLAICFCIMAYGGDRLIFLAILQVFVALIMQLLYGFYCKRNFAEARYSPRVFDKSLLKELTVFSGWNLMNNGAYVFATQGVNMLVNVFFGVTFNASRAVAMQVNSGVQTFVGNFSTAFSPQITKNYAAGDKSYAIHLANRGTKFTWLMMYIFLVPVCAEAETLLQLWLGNVPPLAPLFLRFAMFESLAVTSGSNLFKLIQADGNVRRYTIHAAVTAGLIFPISWLAFYWGAPVWMAYLIFIIDFIILNLVRFYDIKKLMTFSVREIMKDCYLPCIIVSITSFIVPLVIAINMPQGMTRFLINVPVSIVWTLLCCIVFGLTKSERNFFVSKLKPIAFKFFRKQ